MEHLEEAGKPATFLLYVETLAGRKFPFRVKPSTTVEDLKDMIRSKEGIPVDQQRLIYAGHQLEDGKTLEDYQITEDCTLYIILRLRGGAVGTTSGGAIGTASAYLILIPPSLLDTPYHYDFTNTSDNGVEFFRGGSIYIRPCGWKRYALKVKGKYTDDIWLNGKYRRSDQSSSAEDEWAVSYHGTSYHNGLSIASEGFQLSKGKRFLHGKGIYSTPDIEVASLYAVEANVGGKTYKVVMQNRVNPKTVKKVPKAETGVGEYWISPNDGDIRPYGFCVKEI